MIHEMLEMWKEFPRGTKLLLRVAVHVSINLHTVNFARLFRIAQILRE